LSGLLHFFFGGWMGDVPAFDSFTGGSGVIIERLLSYRTIADDSPGLLGEVISSCKQGEYSKALEICESKPGPVAACLAAVLAHRSSPSRISSVTFRRWERSISSS